MLTEIMEAIQPMIVNVIVTVVGIVASYVGLKVKSIYNEKVNTKEKETVVQHTVEYVEQVYKDVHGEEKFNAAMDKVIELLEEKGIEFTKAELEVLIESAVNGFNKGFTELVVEEAEEREQEKAE